MPLLSIEGSFNKVAEDLIHKRLRFPRTVIYCQKCEDCSDIFLLFEDKLDVNFTEPPFEVHTIDLLICI